MIARAESETSALGEERRTGAAQDCSSAHLHIRRSRGDLAALAGHKPRRKKRWIISILFLQSILFSLLLLSKNKGNN